MVNARIRTGLAHRPWADALAVAGDRILAVGSSAEIRKLAGPQVRVVNALALPLVYGGAANWEGSGRSLPAATDDPGPALAPGMVADFLLVDNSLAGQPAVAIAVVGGNIVHESLNARGESS